MTNRTTRLLLILPLASMALALLYGTLPPASAQNANQARSNDSEEREDNGGAEGRGRRFGGDRESGGWRAGRRFRRGGDSGRDSDDGDQNQRRGDDGDGEDRRKRPQDSSPRPVSGNGASTSFSTEDWARGLIRQEDKNGDMMLQADEQGKLTGKSKSADLNKDGVIVAEELVAANSVKTPVAAAVATNDSNAAETRETDVGDEERGTRADKGVDRKGGDDNTSDDSAAASSDSQAIRRVYTGSAGGNKSKVAADKRRTYRFTPAADRMPADLPGSFKSRDRNGDGQIAMNEFSRTWSKRTVADFRRHDLNGDGIITPQEALKSNWR